MKNLIGITMGDPKGIGPEIIAKAWKALAPKDRDRFVIYGDHTVMDAAGELVGTEFGHKHLVISSSTQPPVPKIDETEAARLTLSAIDAALADALAGRISAIVTAPVGKLRCQRVKPNFTGHTEYLAKASHIKDAVMMFACAGDSTQTKDPSAFKEYAFSIVTQHLPIKDVANTLTKKLILGAIRQTHMAMSNYFARPDARIGVMSLNPHGGEGGALGLEEKSVIAPAIEAAVKEGIHCVGPISSNGIFNNMDDFDYDAVVAMYHDQGLVPMKILCRENCVNLTLGLPFVRTSPMHGTAEDIAWLGTADETSMVAAIRLALKLAGRQAVEKAPSAALPASSQSSRTA